MTADSPMPVTFDAGDVDYLAGLGTSQLRREIRNADNKFRLARCQNIPAEIFWRDFADACKLAIRIIERNKPKPTFERGRKKESAEDIKARYDLVDYIGQYTRLRKAGNNFTGICPLHSEKRPSLMVYPDKQSWHCYGACNTGGSVIDFVMKYENLDFKGALLRLGGR